MGSKTTSLSLGGVRASRSRQRTANGEAALRLGRGATGDGAPATAGRSTSIVMTVRERQDGGSGLMGYALGDRSQRLDPVKPPTEDHEIGVRDRDERVGVV